MWMPNRSDHLAEVSFLNSSGTAHSHTLKCPIQTRSFRAVPSSNLLRRPRSQRLVTANDSKKDLFSQWPSELVRALPAAEGQQDRMPDAGARCHPRRPDDEGSASRSAAWLHRPRNTGSGQFRQAIVRAPRNDRLSTACGQMSCQRGLTGFTNESRAISDFSSPSSRDSLVERFAATCEN